MLSVACLLVIGAAAQHEVANQVKSESNASCCWCQGKCCNPSPFPNDDRCVCGSSGADWKTPEQCKAPSPPSPVPSGSCAVTVRNDCGYTGINEAQCTAKGCCWSPGSAGPPWCFYGASPTPPQPPTQQCTKTAVGQRSIYLPNCFGSGCGAPYNDP